MSASTGPDGHVQGDSSALDLPLFPGRQSLRERAADALRAALVAGEMRPGVTYSAPSLAAQFGVSATPVREAMLDLAKEGLVEPVRNKGFRVTELSDRDLDEITELRSLVEVPTVGAIARRHDAAAVEALRPLADEIVASAEARDLIRYIDYDRRFHLGLLALAGNDHLVETIRDLRARSRLYGLQQLAEAGELTASAREHAALLDRVLAGDSRGAVELMRHHIGHVRGVWAGAHHPPK
ncbi:MAG: GntR family transcriptional regulator [Actinomycetales bacterium]